MSSEPLSLARDPFTAYGKHIETSGGVFDELTQTQQIY